MTTASQTADRFAELRAPLPALVITLLFTGVALLENTLAPWAPFYFFYIWLTTVLPMGVGGFSIGSFRGLGWRKWALILALPVLLQVFAGLWSAAIYPRILEGSGVDPALVAGTGYDVGIALQEMFRAAAAKWGSSPGKIQFFYLGLILLWAAFGEEIFFRGYLYTSLRGRWGMAAAAAVSSLLFGVRHATQLGLLIPDYPWGAACSWSVIAFVAGLALCWLFEKTGSLAAPILAHYVFNLIPMIALLAGS